MLKSLLVGLNGCPATSAVIDFALQTALRADALVAAIPIVDVNSLTASEAVPLGAAAYKHQRDHERIAKAQQAAKGALANLSIAAQTRGVRYELLETESDPQRELPREAHRFDAIVVSQRPLNGDLREPDSLLVRLMQQSPRPVIAVPPELRRGDDVVIAYDGSLQSARALQLFACLWPIGAVVHVVSVQSDAQLAKSHAEVAREFLARQSIEVSSINALSGDPGRTLCDFCLQQHAGLLVMGAYGKPTWRQFFFGTVTKQLLAESRVPLWLYH